MPQLYTQGALSLDYTQDDIEAAPDAVRSATFRQALTDLPGWSLVRREQLANARKYGRIAFPLYSAEQSQQYMAERGLGEHFTFDRPYNGDELRILASRKQKELKRAYVLSRADSGAGATIGRLGIQLATSLLDPVAVGSAFIPVVGQTRYAAMLGRASGVLGRAGVRAGVGAVEGAVGAAVVEPIIYAAKSYEQADYDLTDSMLNIALGGVFGGGLHTIGGAIGDFARIGRQEAAAARVAEYRRYLDQQDELNAPAPFTPLVEVERRLTVADVGGQVEQLYRARRTELEEAIKAAPREADDAKALFGISRREAAEAELKRLDSAWTRAQSVPDRARVMAGEDGPLWQSLVNAERGENLAAVDARIAEIEQARPQAESQLRAAEESPTSPIAGTEDARTRAIRDAHRELRKIDAELLQLRPVAEGLRQQLKDVPAMRVLMASPEAREAAMRVGMAQVASGEPIEVRPIFDRSSWREAAKRLADPDQAEFANPEAVLRADAALAQGETVETAAIQQQVQELDTRVKAIEQEAKLMGDETANEEFAGIREDLAALEKEAKDATQHAQMLVVCAMRHAA